MIVFGALPISSRVTDAKAFGREVGEMWSYVTFGFAWPIRTGVAS